MLVKFRIHRQIALPFIKNSPLTYSVNMAINKLKLVGVLDRITANYPIDFENKQSINCEAGVVSKQMHF